MHSDTWYDLAIRELSDLSDPAKEKLAEAAAENLGEPDVEDEEPTAPVNRHAAPTPETEAHHRG